MPGILYPRDILLAPSAVHYCFLIIYDLLENNIVVHLSRKKYISVLSFSFLTWSIGYASMENTLSVWHRVTTGPEMVPYLRTQIPSHMPLSFDSVLINGTVSQFPIWLPLLFSLGSPTVSQNSYNDLTHPIFKCICERVAKFLPQNHRTAHVAPYLKPTG